MLSMRLLKQFIVPSRRINIMSAKRNKPPSTDQVPKPETSTSASTTVSGQATESNPVNDNVLGTSMHYVSTFDKYVLVWVKKYPSVDQVPRMVPWSTMQHANTTGRIRVCNMMIVVTIIAFITAVMSGKKEAAGGRHVFGERLQWIQEQKMKGIVESEKKAEAEALAKK
ncbi:uncharacterized protein LOC117220612 [Megalopta genalis]|uniref:uncharacterized protein LOC117220612 n=1 Tax=Megalopta genalis TaxID=115081 RepID=UPI003FD3182A